MLAFTMSLCPLLQCPGRAILRERGVFSSLSAAVAVKISTHALDVPESDMVTATTSEKVEAAVQRKVARKEELKSDEATGAAFYFTYNLRNISPVALCLCCAFTKD